MLKMTHRTEVPRGRTLQEEAEAPPSFLGPGVGIEGALEIQGELVVSGLVRGRIAALKLVIAAGGTVEGDIVAREVVIAGRLNGRVFAPTVSIEASAEVVQNDAPTADAPLPGVGSVTATETATETEVHLLQRAQSALGGSPASALALTDEHARRFAGGALAQEREFIAVSALLALGRGPEARARAARLIERFPGTAYRGRLESLGLGN